MSALSLSVLAPLGWNLAELPKPGPLRVGSTFACGGGSCLGYRRAGLRVVAANDIDPAMAAAYQLNHRVETFTLGSVSSILDDPAGWTDLDVLDGSPPCTPFSKATRNGREGTWGVAKHYTEGETTQRLDDLYGEFVKVVAAVQPRVVISENVPDLAQTSARGYLLEVWSELRAAGYPNVTSVVLTAAAFGVPQHRRRLFTVAARADVSLEPWQPPAPTVSRATTVREAILDQPPAAGPDECCGRGRYYSDFQRSSPPGTNARAFYAKQGKRRGYGTITKLAIEKPAGAMPASCNDSLHPLEVRCLTTAERVRMSGFPDDYQFPDPADRKASAYLLGMSVPPPMAEAVARSAVSQWLE